MAEIKQDVVDQMRLTDETLAYQFHRPLTEKGFSISLQMILRRRTALDWMFRGRTCCQLIRKVNKGKQLAWARDHLNDTFIDVIWSDK